MRFALLVQAIISLSAPQNTHFGDAYGVPAKHDYQQTFKYPYFTKRNEIPYFTQSGDVYLDKSIVRLVPSLEYKSGRFWCKKRNPHKEWMVEFSFDIHGKNPVGGDGLVFWYSDVDPNNPPTGREFYGTSAQFKGLAIVFDSSDTAQNRYNPFIYAIQNDGTKSATDFINYSSREIHLGACYREYRNAQAPVWVKVIYSNGKLRVDIDIRQRGRVYTNCFESNLNLPSGYRFGLTASTLYSGGTDDHDIYSFDAYELNPATKKKVLRPHEEEDIKDGKEFKLDEKYQEKIEKFEKKVHAMEREHDAVESAEKFDLKSLERLQETQFHILETVDVILEKVDGIPTSSHDQNHQNVVQSQHGMESRLTEELKNLKEEMGTLRNDLTNLHRATADLKRSSEILLMNLDSKIKNNGNLLQNATDSNSNFGNALMAFAGLMGIVLLVIAYFAFKKSSNEKKFV